MGPIRTCGTLATLWIWARSKGCSYVCVRVRMWELIMCLVTLFTVTNRPTNQPTSQSTSQPTNVRSNERMNERTNERSNQNTRLVAPCDRHGRRCRVKKVTIFTCGFSCKGVASINPSAINREGTLGSAGSLSDSTTAVTFWGCMFYIDKHQPIIVLLENLDTLADEPADGESLPNIQVVQIALTQRGYEVTPLLLGAQDYGLPQTRRRFFFLCIRQDAWCLVPQFFSF